MTEPTSVDSSNKVAVVLVNFNGCSDTLECVESLLKLTTPVYRIVVVDNGSTDNSPAKLREAFGNRIVILEAGENLGFGGGVNIGLNHLLHDDTISWFWILNNDAVVQPDSLAPLLSRAEGDRECGIIGSTIVYYDTPEILQTSGGGWFKPLFALSGLYGTGRRIGDNHPDIRELEPQLVYGASMFVSRNYLDTVGLLAEDYFLYLEEIDWAIRGHKAGFRHAVAPESVILHKQGRSTGTNDRTETRSMTADFYNIHSRLTITRKFYPFALPFVYLVFCVSIIRRWRRNEKAAAMQVLRIITGRQKAPR